MRASTAAAAGGFILAGLLATAPLRAQAPETPPAVSWQEAIDGFFARVAAGEPAEAVDGLYAGHPWMASMADQVVQLRTQFVGLSDLVGEYVGNERLAVQPISERFVYVWHVAFYERQPLQFHFTFYKPKDRWTVLQFAYDQGVVDVAKEMARRRVAEGGAEPR